MNPLTEKRKFAKITLSARQKQKLPGGNKKRKIKPLLIKKLDKAYKQGYNNKKKSKCPGG